LSITNYLREKLKQEVRKLGNFGDEIDSRSCGSIQMKRILALSIQNQLKSSIAPNEIAISTRWVVDFQTGRLSLQPFKIIRWW